MGGSDGPHERLRVERRLDGMSMIVRAAGEVDLTTAPILATQLAAATNLTTPPAPVVADLRNVSFFGCKGIAVLLTADQRCVRHNTVLRVLCARPVTRSLEISGLQAVLTISPTLHDALAATV